jgi:hypothetical protein
MKPVSTWNIEGYLAVELCCCFKYSGKFLLGWDVEKVARLRHFLTKPVRVAFRKQINKVFDEVGKDHLAASNRIAEYCSLVPQEYRDQLYDRCVEIVGETAQEQDIKMLETIRKHLKIELQAC